MCSTTFIFSNGQDYIASTLDNLGAFIANEDLEQCKKIFEHVPKSEIESKIGTDLLLHKAVSNSSIDILKFLVENVDTSLLTSKNETKKNPLHLAVSKKDLPACKLLMNKETLKQKDNTGNTPFHTIVRDSFVECFEAAMEHAVADPSIIRQVNNKHETPVLIAAGESNNEAILLKLLEAGGRCDSKTHRKTTPLHHAAEKGFDRCVKTILDFVEGEQKQNLLDATNKEGQTALILAAKKGFTECCKHMQGTNLNHRDNAGCTALQYACSKGSISCVEYLIFNNADVSIRDKKNQTALYKAAANDSHECLIFLLENMKCFENEHDEILFITTKRKNFRNLQKLLEKEEFKKLINKQDSKGNTCLHLSIKDHSYDIAIALLDAGAEKNIANIDREYPLHLAVGLAKRKDKQTGLSELCNRLIKGSYTIVNECTKDGESPLHFAARSGNIEAVKALILRGCKLNKINNEGFNCIQIAAKEGHHSILQILLSKNKIEKRKIDIRKPPLLHLATESGHMACCEVIVEELKVYVLFFKQVGITIQFLPKYTLIIELYSLLLHSCIKQFFANYACHFFFYHQIHYYSFLSTFSSR